MSISLAVPAGVMAVSSLTIVPEAQAFGLKSIKNAAKKTKRVVKKKYNTTKNIVTGKRCKGGSWINTNGLCGVVVPTPRLPKGRIGESVKNHDHRPRGGVAISYNPLRW